MLGGWGWYMGANKGKHYTYPINIKNMMAAVISAPRLAGDNIPNMANTNKQRKQYTQL